MEGRSLVLWAMRLLGGGMAEFTPGNGELIGAHSRLIR